MKRRKRDKECENPCKFEMEEGGDELFGSPGSEREGTVFGGFDFQRF